MICDTSARITNLCSSYQPLATTRQIVQSSSTTTHLSFTQQQQLQDLRHEQRVLQRLLEHLSSPTIHSCNRTALDTTTSRIAADDHALDYIDDDVQVARSHAILRKHALLRIQEQRNRIVTSSRRLQALRSQTRRLQQQRQQVGHVHRQASVEQQQQYSQSLVCSSNGSNQKSSSQRNEHVEQPDKSVGTPSKARPATNRTLSTYATTTATLPVNVNPATQTANESPQRPQQRQQQRLQELQREHAILQGVLTDLISCHVPDWTY